LKRLGSGKLDHEEIKSHAFFEGVDWKMVYNRQIDNARIEHKIRINPKYNNANVFSETIGKNDKNYVSGWSFVNKDN